MDQIKQVKIDDIKVGENEVRFEKNTENVDDLAASIFKMGVVVPLIVSASDSGFQLVAGHRRIRAARQAGLVSVPCIVRDSDKATEKTISFVENFFRKDLSPVELAAAIENCIYDKTFTVPEIAKSFGRSENWVQRQRAMLHWPNDILQVIHSGKLSVSAASNIALVTEDTYREFLIRNAIEGGATARTTAAWLQGWRTMLPPEEAVQAEPVDGEQARTPAVPQAPCICCSAVFRTDELSHVPACAQCIRVIREIGNSR